MEYNGIPVADGRSKRPKHALGKRQWRDTAAAGPCIAWIPDANGDLVPYKWDKPQPRKPGRVGITKDKHGRYIIKLRES